MMKDESIAQFAARLRQARKHIDCAESIIAAIQEHPVPTRKLESEILGAVSELKERAVDFLRNS
jgi:hypothetical protein